MKSFLTLECLTKTFPARKKEPEYIVFEDVSYTIDKGEFVCIIGHSGCGKSTILNVLAGLDKPSTGYISMDGKEVIGSSLDRGVVFQNYSLLPWLTALQNVVFGVKARFPNKSKIEIKEHSLKYLKMVGLAENVNKKPSELSGGMRQRVSIARAFATHPKLLLLDEPFGALDALTRGNIQDELIKIWGETKQTVFMITHDVDEAILLADKIILMSNGPKACIAEEVIVNLPRPRERGKIIDEEGYYKIRKHLIKFLVERSSDFKGDKRRKTPLIVDPTKEK
ncbi:nitrate transport ATP-binding subunits C and D [Lentisphaera araneosa HTCC2155]|jgi:nitrate/nitrite transport system ATP-binding protein|uniref:Nitrate transport ATP-binding subunits C and D n=1 Tax=Lentisphaera araneosa HTCC2155 TaxID=313628 RepID=A6DQ15_9BACT|nr:ABC transporter ATP-binding protein [Lentisphaera araneosa]EDM26256.1 nitrate transport ATP-binding subunits C and D [Lentisphaera araneosa HTCC2155]